MNSENDELFEVCVYPDGEWYEEPPPWKSDDYRVSTTRMCGECGEPTPEFCECAHTTLQEQSK